MQKLAHNKLSLEKGHLNYLDGWRGLAIILLLIGHFYPDERLHVATAGVNLFFVLSGFLMAKLLFINQSPISIFYKRRISRIFPALYLFIVIILLYFVLVGLPISWKQVFGAVFLIRNYFPVGFGNAVPFDHIWSLSVEEHSYILLTIIAWLSRRWLFEPKAMLGLCSFIFVLAGVWYSSRYPGPQLYAGQLIHSEVSAFGIFFSSFLFLYLKEGLNREIPALVFPLLAVIGLGMHYYEFPHMITMVVGVGALALLINILHKAPVWMLDLISLPALRQFGLWSFSIYLWQQPFYVLKNSDYLSTEGALCAAILFGVLSYYFLEKPARSYLNRLWA